MVSLTASASLDTLFLNVESEITGYDANGNPIVEFVGMGSPDGAVLTYKSILGY